MWMCSNFLPNCISVGNAILYDDGKIKIKSSEFIVDLLRTGYNVFDFSCFSEYWSVMDVKGEFVQVSMYIVQCIWGYCHGASSGELNGTYWRSISLPFYYFPCTFIVAPLTMLFNCQSAVVLEFCFRVVIKSLEHVRCQLPSQCCSYFHYRNFYYTYNLVKLYHFSLPPINQFDKFSILWKCSKIFKWEQNARMGA